MAWVWEDENTKYMDNLKEFFRQRLIYSCYETIEKTDYRPQYLLNELKNCDADGCIKKVRNYILSNAKGLQSLEPYGKKGLELSLEAIILENKDYQKLFGFDADDLVKACRFNLEQVHYFDM